MSAHERERPAERREKSEEAKGAERPSAAETQPPRSHSASETGTRPAVQSTSRRNAPPGARLWALPTSDGGVWPVWEDPRLDTIARSLEFASPQIHGTGAESDRVVSAAGQSTDRVLRDRVHDASFAFLQRLVICGALLIAGLFAWRLPGPLKFLDTVFIGGSIGYFLYVLWRYGFGALRWHNWRVDAAHSFGRGWVERSKLCERMEKALKLRMTLKEDERGKSPDDELLDTNAWRKLIEEGVTTAEELSRVGRAVEEQLGLRDPLRKERKISEAAAEAGINVPTALFYADMANAAAEIRIEYHVREVFGER